ncbi:hypothetical protein ACFY85_46550, partial [Streptomyces antimycoticus]
MDALHAVDHNVGRGDLSDEQWSVLESLLPAVGIKTPNRMDRRWGEPGDDLSKPLPRWTAVAWDP